MPLSQTIESRFWPKVKKTDGCWYWKSSVRGNGYGQISDVIGGKRKSLAAHRVSYEIHNGPIPDGLFVMHSCDNRRCVNPGHLSVGTQSDNMRDAASKGRICTVGKARLTHCKRGHEFTAQTTYIDGSGHRRCRVCALDYQRIVRNVQNPRT